MRTKERQMKFAMKEAILPRSDERYCANSMRSARMHSDIHGN